MLFIEPIRNFYGRFERPISSLSLISGFVFDAVTLKRVDTLWENIWILGHLLIVGIFIILIHTQEKEEGDEANPGRKHFWYVNILQFFFGGILSTYLVFYFRSADIFTTWPFIVLLAGAFWANESLKRHYVRFSFQISLFYLSVYSFAIFLVPIILHKIGTWVFILSGLVSLIFIVAFIFILSSFVKREFAESKKLIISLILGITVLINILYFTNLIPPMPLSLKDAGVYHTIEKNNDGNYVVAYENSGWKKYFDLYPDFYKTTKAPVYAFSAIFSPRGLNTTILHEWQYYDNEKEEWVSDETVNLPVRGGRDGGFRTYSRRSSIGAGKWKVNIKTESGQTIGHLRFQILPTDTEPMLTTGIK
ncbi:MAG: DUF2914 domain-containing protein [Minisyncoccia bacterium]